VRRRSRRCAGPGNRAGEAKLIENLHDLKNGSPKCRRAVFAFEKFRIFWAWNEVPELKLTIET